MRQIIPSLNYDLLTREGVIPDLVAAMPPLPATKHFRWVYTAVKGLDYGLSTWGMTMDHVVRRMLGGRFHVTVTSSARPGEQMSVHLGNHPPRDVATDEAEKRFYDLSLDWKDVLHEAHLLSLPAFEGGQRVPSFFTREQLVAQIPTLQNLRNDLLREWERHQIELSGERQYEVELAAETVVGHPDMVTDQAVVEIKTTASFKSMAASTMLQVLAYVALRRYNRLPTRYAALLLPVQRRVVVFDLQQWDSTLYLTELMRVAHVKLNHGAVSVPQALIRKIGSHVGVKGYPDLPAALRDRSKRWGNPRPAQAFILGRSNMKEKTKEQLEAIRSCLVELEVRYYTHAHYFINLCCFPSVKDENDYMWSVTALRRNLVATAKVGGRGVVVHVGKHLDRVDRTTGVERMFVGTQHALADASPECRLLIETPAGQGTELLTTIEELAAFYVRFDAEQRTKLGICVDTCHVFASGYDPLDYLQRWSAAYGHETIGLVHFNDSKERRGSCLDRHSFFLKNKGYIGIERMLEIAAWCTQHEIDMVVE